MRTIVWFGALTLSVGFVGCEDATKSSPGKGVQSGSPTAAAVAAEDDFESALKPEDQGKVVANIGDLQITLKEFERRLKQQAPYARARYASLERKKEFLDNLVRFEVLAAEAARKGYDRDADVIQQMKQTMVRKLMTKEVSNLVKLSDISDAQMTKYYEEHGDQYHKPEQVRVSHIQVGDAGRAKKLHGELDKKIAADKRSYRKTFAEYARKHSEDAASKPRGGDLRFFARTTEGGDQAAEVSDAAFALAKVGDLSAPVKSAAGWHVLLLTGRKNRYDRTFEQVKRQIQNRLYRREKRERTDGFVADLKTAAKVVINEAELAKVEVSADEGTSGGKPLVGKAEKKGLLGPVDAAGGPAGLINAVPRKPPVAHPAHGAAHAPAKGGDPKTDGGGK